MKLGLVTAILDGMLMRIGLSILFGLVLNMDYVGFWLGDALAGFTPFFIGIVYYFSGRWKKGQIVYGAVLGILTGLFRLFGGSAEGVSYAIIIGNLLVPLIEKVTLPKPFGKGGEK